MRSGRIRDLPIGHCGPAPALYRAGFREVCTLRKNVRLCRLAYVLWHEAAISTIAIPAVHHWVDVVADEPHRAIAEYKVATTQVGASESL